MKIGVAGPIALDLLSHHLPDIDRIPNAYRFAPMASWVEELLTRGHSVSVFALSPEVQQPMRYEGESLTVHVGRYRPSGRARDFFAVERRDLQEAMSSDVCDVVHAHWTYEFALAALASKLPALVTAHDAPFKVLRRDPSPYRFNRSLMALLVARRATHMTAVSPYVADHFQRFLGYRGIMDVIPNGLSEAVFALGQHPNRSTDASQPVTFASILMGWSGLKNGQQLIRAFGCFHRMYPESRLLMFGAGHELDGPAETWSRKHRLAAGIEFVGVTDHTKMLTRISQEVDILVHPSLEESFGMAIAEGMAMGLPVIAGAGAGGVDFVVKDRCTGILVDVRRSSAIVEAMVLLATDSERRRVVGETARKDALARFSISSVADAYESTYRRVIQANQ